MKSFHVAGYSFKAEIRCCDCIAEWTSDELRKEGYSLRDIDLIVQNNPLEYDAGVYGYRSEILLRTLAKLWRIHLEDEYSFDSDDFPKLIFSDQIEDDEFCFKCGDKIP
jgi:hypothetical protein